MTPALEPIPPHHRSNHHHDEKGRRRAATGLVVQGVLPAGRLRRVRGEGTAVRVLPHGPGGRSNLGCTRVRTRAVAAAAAVPKSKT